MLKSVHEISAIVIVICSMATAWAGDWPRFLGRMQIASVEAGEKISRSWPNGKPAELWTVDVGEGFGGAAIAAGKVFILDRRGKAEDVFRVFDLKTGQTIWEYAYAATDRSASYPDRAARRPSTAIALTPSAWRENLSCFDLANKRLA